MSGPEWTPEHTDAPLKGRSLSAEVGADGSIHHPPPPNLGPNPFGAGRAKGFDPKRIEWDDAEAEANRLDDEAATTRTGKLAGLVGAIRSAVAGLWNRQGKPDPNPVESDSDSDPVDGSPSDPDSDSDSDLEEESTSKPSRRWPPSAWSWETRVGLAAVLSFLILVGVFVVKKGWVGGGGKSVVLELPKTTDKPKPENPDRSKPGDSTKLATVPTKSKSNQATGPSNAGPSTPGSAAGDSVASVAPTTPPEPDAGGLPLASTPGADLTSPSAGDASKPTELPGPTSDAPPLPDGPVGGSLPTTSTASNDPKPDPKAAEVESPAPTPTPAVVASPPPPEPNPAIEPAPSPPTESLNVAETATLAPTSPPTPEPKVVEAAPPQPAKPPSGLEAVPPSSTVGLGAALGPGWVVIPSGGRRPGGGPSIESEVADNSSGVDSPTKPRVADGPPIRDDPTSGDAAGGGPVLHTVGPDENFWTISKDYYNSHRYYKALHKANANQVPDIAKLYVGTVIRIPPPEALDRSLVEPPTLGASQDGPSVSRVSSPKTSDPDAELAPTRTTRPGLRRARNEPTEEPRRQPYKVKPNDTLRSIARDTLGDSKRASEIFNLNRELLNDPKTPLAAGTSLTLPEDAVIGRRVR